MGVAEMASAMSDHWDHYWEEEKYVNRIVSQVYNIQSFVLDSENMKVYLANGNSPIHLGSYQEYDLGKLFSGDFSVGERTVPAYQFRNPRKADAKRCYIDSFVDAFEGNFSAALERVKAALEIDFSPEAGLVAAILQLKAGQYSQAETLLAKSRDWVSHRAEKIGKPLPPEYFEISLYLARAYDLLGKRSEAQKEYHEIAQHSALKDEHLRRLASAPKPYQAKRLDRVMMPYSTYIPFN